MNNRQLMTALWIFAISMSYVRHSYGVDYADYAAQSFSVIAKAAATYDACKAQNFIHGSPDYYAVNKVQTEMIDKVNSDPKELPDGISAEQLRAIYTRVLQEEQMKANAGKGSLTQNGCKNIERTWNNTFTFGDKGISTNAN
jgi:hypothetical protein